jgi:hypothetical protein
MEPVAIVDQLASVRGKLERTCAQLTSPSAEMLDLCAGELQSAIRQLAECQPQMGTQAGNPRVLEEAWRVRRTFLHVRRLIQSAAAFHANWVRLRGTISGGYTSTGEPVPVIHQGRVCLQA